MQDAVPFPFAVEDSAFMSSFGQHIAQKVSDLRSEYMSNENTQRFMHGTDWQPHNSSTPDDVSKLQKHSFYVTLSKQQVIDADLSALFKKIEDVAAEIDASTRQMLYQTVSAAAEGVGNVVSGGGKLVGEAFYEMIERLEFGVDKNGEPTLPQIHAGAETLRALRDDPLLHSDTEFRQRLESLIETKKDHARAKEANRVARFKRG